MANHLPIDDAGSPGSGPLDCARFDAGVLDALDGKLSGTALARFRAHAAACAQCGPSFAEIEQGLAALRSLEEVEAPASLVHNVLARTTFAAQPRPRSAAPEGARWWVRWREGGRRPLAQPRFAMSLGMAFFSITLLLNVGGVKAKDFHLLRPSTLRATATVKFYETEAHVVKYYENLRVVYEFESRYREIKNNEKPAPGAKGPERKGGDTSRLRRNGEPPSA